MYLTMLHMVGQFDKVVTLEVRVKVYEFQERFHIDRSGFCQALLNEYMLDDHTRVMNKVFLE